MRGAEDDTFAATTIAEGRMVRFLFLVGLVGCMCLAAAFLFPDDWRSFRLAVADSTVGPGAVVSDVYDSVRGKH